MGEINEAKMTELINQTNSNAEYFINISNEVVSRYSTELDTIMENVQREVVSVDYPSVEVLEKYFLELSNCIYFVTSKVEQLGIFDAVSKISYKESYNNRYMNPDLDKAKPTVAELTAYAENESMYEQTLNEIYSRTYKIMKGKIDAAQTMVSTISKILSRRMSEQQLSNMQPLGLSSGRQILNESVNNKDEVIF